MKKCARSGTIATPTKQRHARHHGGPFSCLFVGADIAVTGLFHAVRGVIAAHGIGHGIPRQAVDKAGHENLARHAVIDRADIALQPRALHEPERLPLADDRLQGQDRGALFPDPLFLFGDPHNV